MAKGFFILFVSLMLCVPQRAQAQAHTSLSDSMVTIMDGIVVPLVNKDYVAPTHFRDNWYVGLYGGANTSYGSDGSHATMGQRTRMAAAITVGKEITPVSDLRMQIAFTNNVGVTDDRFDDMALKYDIPGEFGDLNHRTFGFKTWAMNFDYLPNFTNMMLGFREDRWFYLRGLVGIGGCMSGSYKTGKFSEFYNNEHSEQLNNLDKYDNRRHSLVNLRVGLTGTVLLSRNWNVHFEWITNFADNSFDSNPQTNNTWDGHFDYLVGISYHLHGKGGQRAGFYYAKNDLEFYKRRARAIDDLRDRAAQRQKEIDETPADTVVRNAHVMYTLIAFDEGSDEVDRLQQTNIYTTAYAWMKDPKSDIYITNSTTKDDPLFRRRADAIGKILMERYEVPSRKLLYSPNEKAIKPKGNYIVFIVND